MTQRESLMRGSSGNDMGGTKAPYFDGSQVCAQTDPELFFPENSSEVRNHLKIVKPLCNSCEFKTPCLEYALKYPELQGIWAGTSENERRIMRRYKKAV